MSTLLLDGVDWKTYTRLVFAFAESPGVRLAFDRGRLEIRGPRSRINDAEFLGSLVWVLTEELGLPLKSGGSTTLRRRRKQRGIDPDRCYWIANEPTVRGKRDLDLRVDPPPDLVLEGDVASSLDHLSIYAALAVPEIWQLVGGVLTFHVLATGAYTAASHSRAFPILAPADLMGFLALLASQDENSVVRQFRAWLRQRLPAPPR